MTFIFAHPDAFFASFFGAVLQELLHWYGLRTKISQKRYRGILRSPGYWLITLAVIIMTPIGVILWFAGSLDALALRDFVLLGAAFPTLVKTVVARASAKAEVTLGAAPSRQSVDTDKSGVWETYLKGR